MCFWRKPGEPAESKTCAPVEFPLYVVAEDDWSFTEVKDSLTLFNWFEFNDVTEGMYQGWDSAGHHFVLTWDEEADCTTIPAVSPEPDWPGFRAAVELFCERYKDYRKFGRNDCTPEMLAARLRAIMPT